MGISHFWQVHRILLEKHCNESAFCKISCIIIDLLAVVTLRLTSEAASRRQVGNHCLKRYTPLACHTEEYIYHNIRLHTRVLQRYISHRVIRKSLCASTLPPRFLSHEINLWTVGTHHIHSQHSTSAKQDFFVVRLVFFKKKEKKRHRFLFLLISTEVLRRSSVSFSPTLYSNVM